MKKKFVIAVVIAGLGGVKQLIPFTGEMCDTERMAEMIIEKMLKESRDDEVKVYCILPCYVKDV